MLINLVRDSVLQCFCHTCKVPIMPAAGRHQQAPIKKAKMKPRTKQPKKVKFITTEIRCQEKSRGGLCYEVILAEPSTNTTPKRAGSPPTPKNLSVEEIQEKLKKAEERRLSLEANKMAAITAKMAKIEEASRKKDEQTSSFIVNTKEALDAKMETHIEKREAYINDLKKKMKEHLESVEKSRLTLDQQTEEVRNAMQEKVNTVTAHRDENIKKMLERLKEHDRRAEMVRQNKAALEQEEESPVTASSG
ncbi:tropomyosin-1 isoform X3 [Ctenocephalides felis]|uniref:tropomyosin-1 isoform X3 n=1 Tax=Ctenocephalides felis TaxID=7515 RepID=UPI000E6E2E17|nr:tropomyosin-1 isoform X3 [Ctenocephalides felis]